MSSRFDRMGTWAGLAAALIVGVPVLFGGADEMSGPVPVWWAAYLTFVSVFVIDNFAVSWRPSWLTYERNFAVLTLSAAVAYVLLPWGMSPVLLVIAAINGAFVLTTRGTRNQVVIQSIVIGWGMWLGDGSLVDAITSTVVYGAFQTFAVLMVHSRRRESEAHEKLAAANTELKASAAVLAESSRTSERLRIARELHDLVGHQLTALSLELEVASHRADGAAREHVVRAQNTAKDLLRDVRKAVGELRERTPGLERPLRDLIADVTQLDISLEVVEETEVDEQVALTVVRCVQEAVTNTLRHARARRLWITVHTSDHGVTVEARDDGQGVAGIRPGNGLTGMRERVEHCGGELRLHSAQGEGFRVAARVPAT